MTDIWLVNTPAHALRGYRLDYLAERATPAPKLTPLRADTRLAIMQAPFVDYWVQRKLLEHPNLAWVCLIDEADSEERALLYDHGAKFTLTLTDSLPRRHQVEHNIQTWLSQYQHMIQEFAPLQAWISRLTKTQYEVLQVSSLHEPAEDCARFLSVSPRTIEAHRYHSMKQVTGATYREMISDFRRLSLALGQLGCTLPMPEPRTARLKPVSRETA